MGVKEACLQRVNVHTDVELGAAGCWVSMQHNPLEGTRLPRALNRAPHSTQPATGQMLSVLAPQQGAGCRSACLAAALCLRLLSAPGATRGWERLGCRFINWGSSWIRALWGPAVPCPWLNPDRGWDRHCQALGNRSPACSCQGLC